MVTDTSNTTEPIDSFSPCIARLQPFFTMSKKNSRYRLVDFSRLDLGPRFNNAISNKKWLSFVNTTMHYSPKNLWYRLLHNKMSNKQYMHQNYDWVEDNKYQFCNSVETEKHLLFSCPHKQDVWEAIFKQHFGPPHSLQVNVLFKNMKSLNLDNYYIRNLDMQASIIDIFTTTLRHIWAAHWRHFYDGVPFDCSIVTDRINKELQKLIRFQGDIY